MNHWTLLPLWIAYSICIYKIHSQSKEIKYLKGNIKHIEEYLKKK